MRNLRGVRLDAAINRKDGRTGVIGASENYALKDAMKIIVPFAFVVGGGWAALQLTRRGLKALSDELERQKAHAAAEI